MAKNVLSLFIGKNLSNEDIKKALEQHTCQLEVFLVKDLEYLDIRATYCDDSFEIDSVDSHEDGLYTMGYNFEWEAYYGCRDLCNAETEYSNVKFKYLKDTAYFEHDVPEQRSTRDEY